MNTGRTRVFPLRRCAGLFVLLGLSILPAPLLPAAQLTGQYKFLPLNLGRFYQRTLMSYRTNDAFGAVPKGNVDFDGVPFRMFGKIELNGLGPSRDNNFMPTRTGEIPVGCRFERLHLISGAGYKDPDHTPLAEVRLHYTNGEMRHLFLSYGEHVRNWHVESDERRTDLSDRNSSIIWNGTNGATGRPLRLFKNSFNNPLPGQEVRGIELLSLFGKAFPLFLTLTLEEVNAQTSRPPALADDPDDSPYRREILVRVVSSATGKAITNAVLEMTVTEGEQQYRFGRHPGDQHGQILLDYPPGRFEVIDLRLSAPGHRPLILRHGNDEGIYPAEIPARLDSVGENKLTEPPARL